MNLRDSIKGDFLKITDDLEAVELWSRESGKVVALCPHAKRSRQRDAREEVSSFGFTVSDFVSFQIASTDLGRTQVPRLGDWLVDSARRKYVIAGAFHGRMTERLRLKTISLEEVMGSLVNVTVRSGLGRTGAPGARDIVRHMNVPARVWPVDQLLDGYLAEDMRPRYRCAFFSDGQQVRLPLPRDAGIQTATGESYDILGVRELDKLAGFAVADMVLVNDKRAL